MLAVVILAAGKGTRMKSPLPKVLHLLGGEPLIIHVLETALSLKPKEILTVIGHKALLVEKVLSSYAVKKVLQDEQLGTGHAVQVTEPYLADFEGNVLVLCGDVPLIRPKTLEDLYSLHRESGAAVTVLTAEVSEPRGYGRIIRNEEGLVDRIVEEKDASPFERAVKEINTGTYVFEKGFLFEALKKIRPDNVQNEYYLTDVVALARSEGRKVAALKVSDETEILGVNSQFDLARAEKVFQSRLREKFQQNGVTFIFPEAVYLERRVQIRPGCVIYPYVSLRGETILEEEVIVESHCDLKDVRVGTGALIGAGRILCGGVVPPGVKLAPSEGLI